MQRRIIGLGIGILVCSAGAVGARGQVVLYVDGQATSQIHSGATWCTAFLTLHEAMAFAALGTTIHVADGVYLPDSSGLADPRDATFLLRSGTIVRGGFAGCGAADPDAQDPTLFETVLSGDLNGDDSGDFGGQSDNVRHVVSADAASGLTVLEGVTIEGGNADGLCCDEESNGGGMYVQNGSPAVIGCRFRRNSANRGGGLYNDGGSPFLFDCQFEENRALFGLATGGGVFTSQGAPQLRNCLFYRNHAQTGGGLTSFNTAGGTEVRNCTFVENSADDGAGGIFAAGGLTVANCILWDNVDTDGTAMDESSQISSSTIGSLSLSYSCVMNLTGQLGGVGNFDSDPLFTPGPLGCFYLSHLGMGASPESPCVDAGSESASALGMDSVTTRRDEMTDTGVVDLGYHHPITGRPFVFGDADHDGTAGRSDVDELVDCFSGAGATVLDTCCRVFDFMNDSDVDLVDFADFQNGIFHP